MDWKRFRNLCVTEFQSLLSEYTEISMLAEGIDRDRGCEEIVLSESDFSFESVEEDEDSFETGLVVQNVSILVFMCAIITVELHGV